MPSLFGRSKPSSSSLFHQNHLDEFGALPDSPSSHRHKEKDTKRSGAGPYSSTTDLRAHPDSPSPTAGPIGGYAHLPDGAFFPTLIPLNDPPAVTEYGYLATDSDIYLGLDDAMRLLSVVDHELSNRGR